MFRNLALGMTLILCLVAAPAARCDDTEAAKKAAAAFLAKVDAGDFAGAYADSSSLVHKTLKLEQYKAQMGQLAALGKLVSRKLQSATPAAQLPGAPDGHYVVIDYNSDFSKLKGKVERVTEQLEDGQWKCAGYLIVK